MKFEVINARVTFRKSPIHILERFTFKDLEEAHSHFKKYAGLTECVIVQTCNRVELFGKGEKCTVQKIEKTWATLAGLEENVFKENLELSENTDAFHHLLQLTSGLDSMVVGEEQILGQIKNSITLARESKHSGEHLNTLFDKAIRVGTRIRNSTGINQGGISIGAMAVKLAEENIDELKSKKILLIGTGEAATLVAKSLKKRNYKFFVSSRTIERSNAFTQTLGGRPVMFENILSEFELYDVIFVATTAPYFLITYERITNAMKTRKNGMMILDLSNPRTVDEKVATIGGIKLINLDQIAELVDKNKRSRIGKISTVENIIGHELPIVEATMRRLNAEPLVKDVFKEIDSLRVKELRKALEMLGETDEKSAKVIEELTKAVVESVVSTPMNNLRKATEQGNSELLDAASKLFDYKKKE